MSKRTTVAKWLPKYNRWQIKVRKDGVRKTFTCPIPGRKGQIECHRKADAWLEEGLTDPNVRVSVLFDKMIEQLKINTSKTHWRHYEQFGRLYIKPAKGTKRVASLTENDLQDIVTYAYEHPAKGKPLSEKTFKDIIACIKYFIKYARKEQVTKLHPENLHVPHGAAKSNKGTLLPDDLIKLFSSSKTTWHKKEIDEWFIHAWRFEVVTGMRPGEIAGLKDSDIKNNICSIKRAINWEGEVTTGKNRNAQRTFVIPEIGMSILRDQRQMLKRAGIISPYVFPDVDGDHFLQPKYNKHWTTYRDYNGLSKRTPYEMRHTFFSAVKELPKELIKPMGGHSKDFDTFGHYGHELPGEAEKAAVLVDTVFRNLLGRG